jgi:hypothetical protein
MTGGWTRGKLGLRYAYYGCGKKECTCRKSIPKKNFEDEFTEFLLDLVPKQEDLEILAESVKLQFKQETGLLVQNNIGVEKQISQLKKEKENLLSLKLKDSSLISDDDFKTHNKQLESQLASLQQALVSPDFSKFDVSNAVDFACELIKNLPKLWQAFEVIDFKALRNILFPENIIYKFPNYQTPTLTFIYRAKSGDEGEKETLVVFAQKNLNPIIEEIKRFYYTIKLIEEGKPA